VKWIGRTFHYFRKPEHMKAVFLDHADIFKKSQFQKRRLRWEKGLLRRKVSTGNSSAAPHRLRSGSTPGASVPAFSSSAAATVERIKAMPAGLPVDVMQEMQHATLDVIVETILGGADPDFSSYDRMAHIIATYMETMGKPDMLDMFPSAALVLAPVGR